MVLSVLSFLVQDASCSSGSLWEAAVVAVFIVVAVMFRGAAAAAAELCARNKQSKAFESYAIMCYAMLCYAVPCCAALRYDIQTKDRTLQGRKRGLGKITECNVTTCADGAMEGYTEKQTRRI